MSQFLKFRSAWIGLSALVLAAGIGRAQAAAVPVTPSNLNVTVGPYDWWKLTLNWTDNSLDETGFKIERSTDGYAFSQVAIVGANTTSYVNSSLTAVTTYYYRVRAYSASGDSIYSNIASQTTKPQRPVAPTNLTATAISSSQINVTWMDASSNEDGFKVFRSLDGTSFTECGVVGPNVTSYASAGLNAATKYYYKVRAYNGGGYQDSTVASTTSLASGTITTPPVATAPAAPTGLTGSAASTSQVNLSWTDASSDETGFKVERSGDGVSFAQVASVGASISVYSDTGLAASSTYQYRVLAYNSAGNSSYSNIASVTTPAPAVTVVLSGLSLSASSVVSGANVTGTVTLSAPAPAGGATVSLSSSQTAVQVPSSVTVASGASSASFTMTTSIVSATTTATLTASYGLSKTASLSVTAPVTTTPTGTVYYVSPSGSDSNPGTIDRPWKTLSKAFASLSAGNTLYLRGGDYVEKVAPKLRQGTPGSPITVIAYPGERPVLHGLLRLQTPSYWVFDGLNVTWQDGMGTTYDHMVKLMNGVGWVWKNSEVWGAKSFANILVAGTVTGEPANWSIVNNVIHDCIKSNTVNHDHLLYINAGVTAGSGLIEHNLLYNALNGMGVKLAGADETQGTANVTVRYNTIYNAIQPVLVGWKSHHNEIYGNIMGKAGPRYACIRSYQLVGVGNVAHNNVGFLADGKMFLNDAGYLRVDDLGGNAFPIDPQFDSLTMDGFHPQNTVAKDYGVYAP